MRRKSLISLVTIVVLAVTAFLSTLGFNKHPTLGLDLQGGASVVLEAQGTFKSDALDQAKEIIRNRVDGLGVAEPEVTRQGNAIVVALPGVKDQNRALDLVGKTAELRFRPVLGQLAVNPDGSTPTAATTTVDPNAPTTTVDPNATTTAGAATTVSGTATTTATGSSTSVAAGGPGGAVHLRQQAATTVDPTASTIAGGSATTVAGSSATTLDPSATTITGTTVAGATTTAAATVAPTTFSVTKPEDDDATKTVVLDQKDSAGRVTGRYVLGPAFLTGDGVDTASAQFSDSGGWSVLLSLKGGARGIDAFNTMAAKCYGGTSTECPTQGGSTGRGAIAIVLDSIVKSAPQIQTPSFSQDQISITGNFKQKEAEDLSLVLRYGALPVKLVPQATQTVSATLGKDSLRAGVIAGIIGVLLVVLLMLAYYRGLAVVVFVGLILSSMLLWSLVSYAGATLTLSGTTGIIVSIGVTVDSYVVFFERLKDDVRSGKSLRSSAQRGFAGAWRTILAADLVSLIGAAVLYYLTVGSVRGFAFYLGLSTICDLVIAYFFTRPAVRLLSQTSYFKRDRVLGIKTGEALAAAGAAR
jgi:preprotein translocase subunit SecD